jgi:uncharacterized membrane protein YfcA
MILGIPAWEFFLLLTAILVGGALAGFLAGVFGVGGGGVMVPVLYEVFRAMNVPEEVRMQLCVGTSLAIILPTALRAFLIHRQKAVLPMGVLRVWALPMVVGVVLGAITAAFAPGWVFKLTFVLVTGLLALKLFLGGETWRLGNALPGAGLMSAYGAFIGLYSSLMGVGGGSVAVLVLTLYGETIHIAVAIATGVGVLIAVTGSIGYILAGLPHQEMMPPLTLGYVWLLGVATIAPVASFVSPYGARLAHALPKRKLELALACFLLAISLRFLLSLVW